MTKAFLPVSKASAISAAGVKVCPFLIGGEASWRYKLCGTAEE
jgi:hypothetical protein